jgi:hypothetical protein
MFFVIMSTTLMLATLLAVPPSREARAEAVTDNNPPAPNVGYWESLFMIRQIRTCANGTEVWATPPKESFKYGYISANVDCREEGQPRRMKFVSQIFTYCYGEVPSDQIIKDNEVHLHQVVKSSCGENYSISYKYLYGPNDTSAQAENARARELKESGYGKHVEWHASVDYPSSKCR